MPLITFTDIESLKRMWYFIAEGNSLDVDDETLLTLAERIFLSIYSTKFFIDDNEFDLIDTDRYYIKPNENFDTIALDNGVVLNCGYETQTVEYFEEMEIDNYNIINNLKKLLNTHSLARDEDSFNDLLISTGLSQYKDEGYGTIIQKAQKLYDDNYSLYLEKLQIKLWERENMN